MKSGHLIRRGRSIVLEWALIALVVVFGLAAVLMLTGCSRPPAAAAEKSEPRPPLPADAVAVVKIDDSMAGAVQVGAIGLHPVPRQIRTTGRVQLDDSRVARLVAPVAGQVSGLHAAVGDRVTAGQPIFYLNSRDAALAVEDEADAHHDLDLAEKVQTMTQDLFDHQAASKISLQQANNDVVKAKMRVERTQAALRALGLGTGTAGGNVDARVPVTSPIAGAVIDRHLSDGQFAQPDSTPLLTIADLSTVWVEADVFERDLRLLRSGESAEVRTTAYPDEAFRAHITRVSDVLDPATRTVKVRFLVANPSLRLKPEMFATITLLVEDVEQALTIPASAVITEGERSFVYVALNDRTFARRPVEVAADSRDTRRVVHGLSAGDRIVTTGAVLLRGHEDHAGN
jgi:cobalt-zinc-cadmium efflux system membrane fusion protein